MLKEAHDNGYRDAFTKMGLAGSGALPAVRNFFAGQAGHLGDVAGGLRGLLSTADSTGLRIPGGFASHGAQAMSGLKGMLPTLGGAAALGLGAHLLGGNDDRRR